MGKVSIVVFDHLSYQSYLCAVIRSLPKRGHGFRIQMAKCMRCEPGYVTRVLKGRSHFSVEQAESLGDLLNLSTEELSFFLLLVEYARSGTKRLQNFKKKQIDEIIEKRLDLRNRIPAELPFDLERQTRYFSHWHYTAVHVLVSVPEFQTKEKILGRLKIPPKRLGEVLEFLLQSGMIVSEAGRYKVGQTRIHLPPDSVLVARNHALWRYRALSVIDDSPDSGIHYSGVMTMSEKDALRIREIHIRAIEEMNAIVKDSKDETMVAFTLDLFSI